jgi:hypothetical protein
MAQIQQTIIGFELGPFVPPSGVNIGYLDFPNGYVTTDITTDSKRSGSYGFKANSSGNKSANVRLLLANTALPSGNGVVWEMRLRYYFRIASTPAGNNVVISRVGSGTNAFEFQLQMDTSRQLRAVPSLCGNTTTAYEGTFATDTWYQVRMRFYGMGSSAGGTVSGGLRESSHAVGIFTEDGSLELASFEESTPVGNNMPAVWPAIFFFGQDSAAGGPAVAREIWYDDFWCHMATDTDVASMEWPRGTNVEVYKPTANGATNNFTRGGVDTGANWSQVSEIPKTSGGGTEYVSSATAGHVDLYQHATLADPDDVVFHIQAVCFLFDSTTPQELRIGATTYSVTTIDSGSARYAIAHQIFSNATAMSSATFDALEFGIKKLTAGGTTLFSEQEFLEVLTGPPNIVEEDLPDGGDPTAFSVTPAIDVIGGLLYTGDTTSLTIATGTLGLRIGGQGVEINVPTPWIVQQIQIGNRDEETS